MIVAVSRFRVANATESAVAAAFLNRPRIVDSWPGFLGLETFRDSKDATVFYLVTRWTDSATFRAWHSSPAHRASHAWMPAGLRLDPSYTRLVELERLSSRGSPDMFNLTIDRAALIGQLLEHSRVVHVLRVALDGTVLFANEAVTAALGVEAADFQGTGIFPRLTEADAGRLRRILGGDQPPDGRLMLNFTDAEGQPLTLACHLQLTPEDCFILGEPEYESDRQLQHQLIAANEELAILARERHRATTAEQAARRAAESASRTKDEALAVIAHELRQPLSAATMAIAVLKARPDALDRVRGTLERQLAHMTTLVEDLLDASRVIRGSIELFKQRVDLRHVTSDALEQIRPAAEKKQQSVSVSLGSDPLEIDADTARFSQILGNVLSNAIKYTPNGGTISVVVERQGGDGVVRVSDSGAGIAPESLDTLFHLFVRASVDAGGLGIGLAVSKRLIEMHGGSITASSDGPGRGSEFILRWPLATAVDADRISGHSDRLTVAPRDVAGAGTLPSTQRMS